jgi:hypothetical protein
LLFQRSHQFEPHRLAKNTSDVHAIAFSFAKQPPQGSPVLVKIAAVSSLWPAVQPTVECRGPPFEHPLGHAVFNVLIARFFVILVLVYQNMFSLGNFHVQHIDQPIGSLPSLQEKVSIFLLLKMNVKLKRIYFLKKVINKRKKITFLERIRTRDLNFARVQVELSVQNFRCDIFFIKSSNE